VSTDRWYQLAVGWAGGLFIGGVLLAIGQRAVPDVLALADAGGHAPQVVAAALLTGTAATWWAAVRLAGPLAASPARQRWWIGDDPDCWQRHTVRRSFPVVLAAAIAVGAVVGLASSGYGPWVAGATITVLLAIWAGEIVGQRRDTGPHIAGWIASAALGLLSAATWGAWIGVLLGVTVAGAVTVRAGRWQWRKGALPPRWNLAAAASRRAGAEASVVLMEAPVFAAPSGSRRSISRVPSRPGPRLAFVVSLRVAGRVGVTIALGLLIAAEVGEVLTDLAGVVVLVVLLHRTTVITTRVLLAWASSESVRRFLAIPRRDAILALSIPCAATTALTIAVAWPLLTLSAWEVGFLLLLPPLATWRRLAQVETADQMVLMSTPMGAVPVQVVTRLVAGIDVTVIVLLVLTLLDQA